MVGGSGSGSSLGTNRGRSDAAVSVTSEHETFCHRSIVLYTGETLPPFNGHGMLCEAACSECRVCFTNCRLHGNPAASRTPTAARATAPYRSRG